MSGRPYPEDIDPQSQCRLPLPRRDEFDAEGQLVYDSLADPRGGSLRGLRGPGGIHLHSPELARHTRPLNRYLRQEAGDEKSVTQVVRFSGNWDHGYSLATSTQNL